MNNIQEFINEGWYTVPMTGRIQRLSDGKKTTPQGLVRGWNKLYSEDFNEKATQLGGVITGAVSGIVIVDCDDTTTYELFKSLDPDYDCEMHSIGKLSSTGIEQTCASLIYLYDDELPESFALRNSSCDLDFLSCNRMAYLPTACNETKDTWKAFIKPKPMPRLMKTLIAQFSYLASKPRETAAAVDSLTVCANFLAPLVEKFVTNSDFATGLFKIITPKSFRAEEQYVMQGYLHPDRVPDGRGSDYLSKVSAILGADASIDKELYNKAIQKINNLWDRPIHLDKLEKTITEPMTAGHSSIDGVPIWRYEENWKEKGLIFGTKRGESVEVFYDDDRMVYYTVDIVQSRAKLFSKDTELFGHLEVLCVDMLSKKLLKANMPLVNAVSDPAKEFGFYIKDSIRQLNTFHQTPELAIINNPQTYTKHYTKPVTTLRYFKSLVPNVAMRNYLLGFLKRKLTTFEYSPVTLYFLGISGSGKDTLVELMKHIVGVDGVGIPTPKQFLEVYNEYMLDTFFVQLDEYGNQLTTNKDREEVLGKLKAYTGKEVISVRPMHSKSFNYGHRVTFMVTANKNPLGIEENDRRIALFSTPNILASQDWVKDIGGISAFHAELRRELKDFCYYLATEVNIITKDAYMTPPDSEEKTRIMVKHMYAGQKIVFWLKNNMFEDIEEVCYDNNITNVLARASEGRIYVTELANLYSKLTDGRGNIRSLNKLLKEAGFAQSCTTQDSKKAYYYSIPNLKIHQPTMEAI